VGSHVLTRGKGGKKKKGWGTACDKRGRGESWTHETKESIRTGGVMRFSKKRREGPVTQEKKSFDRSQKKGGAGIGHMRGGGGRQERKKKKGPERRE